MPLDRAVGPGLVVEAGFVQRERGELEGQTSAAQDVLDHRPVLAHARERPSAGLARLDGGDAAADRLHHPVVHQQREARTGGDARGHGGQLGPGHLALGDRALDGPGGAEQQRRRDEADGDADRSGSAGRLVRVSIRILLRNEGADDAAMARMPGNTYRVPPAVSAAQSRQRPYSTGAIAAALEHAPVAGEVLQLGDGPFPERQRGIPEKEHAQKPEQAGRDQIAAPVVLGFVVEYQLQPAAVGEKARWGPR